jgi:predicted GNAT family N-acyltransferase
MAIDVAEIAGGIALERAFEIRRIVFCDEQGVSREEEFDGLDGTCRQYLATIGDLAVGTARTRPLEDGHIKIERVAVLQGYRDLGVGTSLMERIMVDIGEMPMTLNAQFETKSFYKRLGFSAIGDIFDEAGIAHVRMVRS